MSSDTSIRSCRDGRITTQHVVSKQVFSYVSSRNLEDALEMVSTDAIRTKGNTGWQRNTSDSTEMLHWRFQANDGKKTIYLYDVSSVKIERHIKVKGAASPDDPTLREYWKTRKNKRNARLRQRKVTRKALHIIRVGCAS